MKKHLPFHKIAALCLCFLLAGCRARGPAAEDQPVESPNPPAQTLVEEPLPTEEEDEGLQPFVTELRDTDGTVLEGQVRFSMGLPEDWRVEEALIYNAEGRRIAEVLPSIALEEGLLDKLAAQYPDSEAVEVRLGGLDGVYFHQQTPVEDPAFAGAFNNELIYYLERDDALLCLKFYPAFGVGIGTQREAFQEAISVIR